MKATFSHLRRMSAVAATLALTLVTAVFGQTSASNQEDGTMRVGIEVGDTTVFAVLDDSPTARDFVAMLPIDLDVENYGNNEKIAYLPRKLTTDGSGPFGNETPGDFAYFAPWGNVIVYYGDYTYWPGLVRLGRIEGSLDPLLEQDSYRVHIELVE